MTPKKIEIIKKCKIVLLVISTIVLFAELIILFDIGKSAYDFFKGVLPIIIVTTSGYWVWRKQKKDEREWKKVEIINKMSVQLLSMLQCLDQYKLKYVPITHHTENKTNQDPINRVFKTHAYSVAYKSIDIELKDIMGFVSVEALKTIDLDYVQLQQIISAYDTCKMLWERRDNLANELFNELKKENNWQGKLVSKQQIVTIIGMNSFENLVLYNQQAILTTDHLYDAITYVIESLPIMCVRHTDFKLVNKDMHIVGLKLNKTELNRSAVDFDYNKAAQILNNTPETVEKQVVYNMPFFLLHDTQPWNKKSL